MPVTALIGLGVKAAKGIDRAIVGPPEKDLHTPRRVLSIGVYATATMMLIDGLGYHPIGLVKHEEVFASQKASIILEETIPIEVCAARLEARFQNTRGEVDYKVKAHTGSGLVDGVVNGTVGKFSIAKWKETYNGTLQGTICPKLTSITPRWVATAKRNSCEPVATAPSPTDTRVQQVASHSINLTAAQPSSSAPKPPEVCKTGAYVVTINEASGMEVNVSELKPGDGWKSDSSGFASIVNIINDLVDAVPFNEDIPFLHPNWRDGKENGLRSAVLAEVYNEFTNLCVPQGIKDLSTLKGAALNADAALAQPKTLPGNLIHFFVSQWNQALANVYRAQYLTQNGPPKTQAELAKQAAFLSKIAATPGFMVSENDFVVNFVAPKAGQRLSNQYDAYNLPFAKILQASKGKIDFPKQNQLTCNSVGASKGLQRKF